MATGSASVNTLLWVNKDVKSSSFSNNLNDLGARKAINSHVQAWRKANRAQSRKDPESRHSVKYGEHHFNKSALQQVDRYSKCRCRSIPCVCLPEYSPGCAPLGNHHDPFGFTNIPINAETHRLLIYFSVVWIKTAFRSNVALDAPGWPHEYDPQSVAYKLVQHSLSDELPLYSLLAAMTGRMKYVTGHYVSRPDRPEQFHAKAITLLRALLNGDVELSQHIIVNIFFLSTLEIYNKNIEGARAHLRIMKHLVNSLGGFDHLDVFVREMCWNSDMFIAVQTLSPPIFEITWDPGPLSPDRKSEVRSHLERSGQCLMGIAFSEKSTSLFNPSVLPFVGSIVELAHIAQYFWINTDPLPSDRVWLCKRSEALMLRILSSFKVRGKRTPEVIKQDCRICAVIMWMSFLSASLTGLPSMPSENPIIRKIMPGDTTAWRCRLQKTDRAIQGDWSPDEEFLLWMLSLGTLTSVAEQDVLWFSGRFIAQVHKLGISTYAELTQIFARYLWLDRFEQATGGRLTQLLSSQGYEIPITTEKSLGGCRDATVHRLFGSYGLTILEITGTDKKG